MNHFPVMIDSGAYTAWSKGEEIDLDEYVEFCHEIRRVFPQAVCVNLDVIGVAKESFSNWKRMRKAGINSLPIWHVEGDPDHAYLKRYLKLTDHIGIGAIANMSSSKRTLALDRVWQDYLTDSKGYPTARVHGMGITSFPLMLRYPWHSIDSTSWIQVAMFGHILLPKRRNGRWDYTAMPTKVGFSTKCSDVKNKAKHFDNMSEAEKGQLIRFLVEKGFTLGETGEELCKKGVKKGEMIEVPLVPGVTNDFGMRADLCLEFYAEFLKEEPWPRPFRSRAPRGFSFEDTGGLRDRVSGDVPYTLFYLSGSSYRGEDYVKANKKRLPHVGVLLSFIDLRARGLTWRRLVDLIEDGVLCSCSELPSPHDLREEHPEETPRDKWLRYKEWRC